MNTPITFGMRARKTHPSTTRKIIAAPKPPEPVVTRNSPCDDSYIPFNKIGERKSSLAQIEYRLADRQKSNAVSRTVLSMIEQSDSTLEQIVSNLRRFLGKKMD